MEPSIDGSRKRLSCLVSSPGKPFKIKRIAWTKDGSNIFYHEDKYDTDNFDLIINVSSVIVRYLTD